MENEDFKKMIDISTLQSKKIELMEILIVLNNRLKQIDKDLLEIKI